MDGAVFGSYSLTEFIDLHELNIRNNHHYSMFIEVDSHGVVKMRQGKIDSVSKTHPNNYLIGILSSAIDYLTLETSGVSYFESQYDFDIDYLTRAKKEFFFFAYENSKLTFTTTKNVCIYMSENGSFSTTEPNGYMTIRPNLTHTIPIFINETFITSRREYDIKY